MSSKSRQGSSRPRSGKQAFGLGDLGDVIIADGMGVGVSEREDGLKAPSLSLLCREGGETVTVMLPFTEVGDLDDVIDTLTSLRAEHYGKR